MFAAAVAQGRSSGLSAAAGTRTVTQLPSNSPVGAVHPCRWRTCQGVHYGMFPGDPLPGHPSTVWNVIRPHNWRPATETEWLVQFDADTGVQRSPLCLFARPWSINSMQQASTPETPV